MSTRHKSVSLGRLDFSANLDKSRPTSAAEAFHQFWNGLKGVAVFVAKSTSQLFWPLATGPSSAILANSRPTSPDREKVCRVTKGVPPGVEGHRRDANGFFSLNHASFKFLVFKFSNFLTILKAAVYYDSSRLFRQGHTTCLCPHCPMT
jgi:hypothetical protein